MYKCINAINLPYLNNMLKVKESNFGLRHQKNVVQPMFSTIKYGKNSFDGINTGRRSVSVCIGAIKS